MRILHLNTTYLPYRGGSASRLSQLMEAFGRLYPEAEQHVVCTRTGVSASAEAQQIIEGVQVWRTEGFWDQLAQARRLIRSRPFDLIHAHNPRLALAAKLFAPKTPMVLELHSPRHQSAIRQSLTRLAGRLAARVVILAEGGAAATAAYLSAPPAKLQAIRNGVRAGIADTPLADAPLLPRPRGDERWIGYVGTFYDWQGVEVLARALPHAFAKDERLRAVLVGDGPAKAQVMAVLEAAGVIDRVLSEPAVPWTRAAQYIREIDLFAMLRPPGLNTETVLPLKILEVALLGAPLLISDRGALVDVARPDPEAMLYVQVDLDAQSVGDRLVRILERSGDAERLKRAENMKAHVKAGEYSWERSAERLHQVYAEALDGAKAS